MRRFLTGLLAEILAYAILSSAQDCGINFPGLILPHFVPRIVPVVSADGLMLVWQDGGSISLQRYGSDCNRIGETIQVNSSEDFFSNPENSGLSDAASIGRGATVVTWTLGGDVWTRVVLLQDSTVDFSPVVRVNGASRHSRVQARVTSSPNNSGFVVAWSSWQQDGDGWGVFVRPFTLDAKPLETEEMQVNQHWKHFQWRPQLKWCGSSLWALFANSSGQCSEGKGCSTGPFLRRIAVSGNESWKKDMRDEIDLQGNGPLAAALTCFSLESDNATSFLLTNGGSEVEAQVVSPESSGRSNSSSAGFGTFSKSDYEGNEAGHETSLSRDHGRTTYLGAGLLKQSLDAVPTVARRLQSFLGFENSFLTGQADNAPEVEDLEGFLGAGEGAAFIDIGEVGMIAHFGNVLLLTNTRSGTLSAQLLQFGHRVPIAFPPHKISSGVKSVRAVWDPEGADLMLVLCWTSGSVVPSDGASGFSCIRVSAAKLADSEPFQLDANLAILLMLSVVAMVCCMRQCSRAAARQNGLGNIRRRAMANARQEAESAASQARARELRQQLARIPERPPTFQMADNPLDDTSGTEGSGRMGTAVHPSDDPDLGAGSPAAQLQTADTPCRSQEEVGSSDSASIQWARSQTGSTDVCSICQNDVVMWVALQPCGHTACKQCIMRIVEMNQRCHICRGGIEGVLPVYI